MKRLNKRRSAVVAGMAIVLLAVLGGVNTSQSTIVHGAATDIQVWIEDEYEVYPDMDDIVFCVRAARDCHALVYVVDTDGFIHVVHPFSPYADAWIEGGVIYRITARDAGLYGIDFGRGIAFIYAVGSPYPFDYSYYGVDIYAGRFAYRIYGDPFIACRQFYISLIPSWCNWAYIGVSFSHFYLREWVRYPRYLCFHHGVTYHSNGYCHRCSHIYDGYRIHSRDPYRVLRPSARYKGETSSHAKIASVPERYRKEIRAKRVRRNVSSKSLQDKTDRQQNYRMKDLQKSKTNLRGAKNRSITKEKPQRVAKAKRSLRETNRSHLYKTKTAVKNKVTPKESLKRSAVRSSKEFVRKEKSRTLALKQKSRTDKVSKSSAAKVRSTGKAEPKKLTATKTVKSKSKKIAVKKTVKSKSKKIAAKATGRSGAKQSTKKAQRSSKRGK